MIQTIIKNLIITYFIMLGIYDIHEQSLIKLTEEEKKLDRRISSYYFNKRRGMGPIRFQSNRSSARLFS
jgi:hypothetical protein